MSTMYEDVDMENPDGVSGDGSDVCLVCGLYSCRYRRLLHEEIHRR